MPKSNQNQPTSPKQKLTVDLSANHAKEEKIKEQKQLESEIERIDHQLSSETKKTFETDENEALDEQVLAFKKAFEE